MNENKTKLSPPWVDYYHKIEAMFGDDPDVDVKFNDEEYEIKLLVTGPAKADAITQLLPAERTFGNITVRVTVVPANDGELSKIGLFRAAFWGNPAFVNAVTVPDIFSNEISYVVFQNKVVQYFNDDPSDLYGVESTLFEDIAEDIFEDHAGVYFCTDVDTPDHGGSVGKPLGEWP